MIPGEYLLAEGPVPVDRESSAMLVDLFRRPPVQVGSHYDSRPPTPAPLFDREAAAGKPLAVPAGTAVRFEPGVEKPSSCGAGRDEDDPRLRLPESTS